MLDLTQLGPRYFAQYGEDKVADVAGVTVATVRTWVNKEKWPLEAVSKLLAFDPTPIHEIKPLYPPTPAGTRLIILLPSNRPTDPRVFEAIMRMYDPTKMAVKTFTFNNLNVVRNMAAAYALNGPWEWTFWNDDDVIPPYGDAKAFKDACGLPNFPDLFAGVNTLDRLLSRGKKMIGVSYVGRKKGIGPQMSVPNAATGRAVYARGPQDSVIARDWIGFGGTLVHRSVFEDIIKTQGKEIEVPAGDAKLRAEYNFGFFDASPGVPGDDINFCIRARKAGHEIWADLSLMASHIGSKCFNFEDLR